MFKSIGALTLLCGLCLGAIQTASAHERAYDRHELPRHHHASTFRDRHMPHWLRHDRGFRYWYHRTSLHHNHRLAWWQLYEIFSWERRYHHRGHPAVHYGSRYRDYDWYRRYWKKRHHHHDDRRRHSKRKHRDESRHFVRRDSRRHRDHD